MNDDRSAQETVPSPRSRFYHPRQLTRRHAIALALAVIVLISLCLYGWHWMQWRQGHVEENDARIEGEMVTIASRVDGWLMSRPVMEGDRVEKGETLASLDMRATRLQLAALEASIAAADAQIQQYMTQRETTRKTNQAGVDDARAQVDAAEAVVASAQHQVTLAQADFDRVDALLKSRSISRQAWDNAHSTLLQHQDELREAQAQLVSRRADLADAAAQFGQIDVLTRQIDVQRQQRKSLVAQADQLRQELEDRVLKSPVNGVVDKTMADAGDYVQTGQWVMMIHDPDEVWVEANIKETEIGDVEVGQPVRISVDAYPDFDLHGKVLRVGNAATNQFALLPSPNPSGNFTKVTQRVPVRIALDRHDARLKPGLMVEVSIDVAD